MSIHTRHLGNIFSRAIPQLIIPAHRRCLHQRLAQRLVQPKYASCKNLSVHQAHCQPNDIASLSSSASDNMGSSPVASDNETSPIHLHDRSLLRVHGRDSFDLLQGIITNDMNQLLGNPQQTPHHEEAESECSKSKSDSKAIYAMFLNAQGRILYDSLIYRIVRGSSFGDCGGEGGTEFFLEAKTADLDRIQTHLHTYKLRKKVYFDVESTKDIRVYADISRPIVSGADNHCCVFTDPRAAQLGHRILCFDGKLAQVTDISNDLDAYTRHRYIHGVGENPEELAGGMPLEYNLSLLNGVSFHKGCYIGQELVARTHHTGVIRKRVMPFRLAAGGGGNSQSNHNNTEGTVRVGMELRTSDSGKRIGKVLAVHGDLGLAMARLVHLSKREVSVVNVENTKVELRRPQWWPNGIL